MKEIETWSEMKIAGACMNIIWFEGTCDVFFLRDAEKYIMWLGQKTEDA